MNILIVILFFNLVAASLLSPPKAGSSKIFQENPVKDSKKSSGTNSIPMKRADTKKTQIQEKTVKKSQVHKKPRAPKSTATKDFDDRSKKSLTQSQPLLTTMNLAVIERKKSYGTDGETDISQESFFRNNFSPGKGNLI